MNHKSDKSYQILTGAILSVYCEFSCDNYENFGDSFIWANEFFQKENSVLKFNFCYFEFFHAS